MPNRSYTVSAKTIPLKRKTVPGSKVDPKKEGEFDKYKTTRAQGDTDKYEAMRKKAAEDKSRQYYPKVYQNSLGNPLTEREKAARKNYSTTLKK